MLRLDGSWDCQLRLFLSVDIAGSTKYKNSRLDSDDYPPFWKDLFFKLYQEFHSLLISYISQARRDHTLARKIESWKTIGDEIVFSAHVADEAEVYDIISGFLKALQDYDTEVMGYYPVRIKGSAWTAGFPIRNCIVVPFGNGINDYIGPDIDIGFRLGKHSMPSRTVVSLDLADILSRERTPGSLNFHHVGWSVLKGVFDDCPYPVIWINDGNEGLIPPWDRDEDPFTKKMSEKGSTKTKQGMQELIADIRRSLRHLRLFPPYFNADGMPGHHKSIVENEMKKSKCPDEPIDIPRPFDLD